MDKFFSLFAGLSIVIGSFYLTSCNNNKVSREEYDKLLEQKDSTEAELQTLSGYLGEISQCVDSVAIQEGILLNVVNVETGQPYTKKEIRERVREFGSIIERQKARIQELSQQLETAKGNSAEIARLSSMISFLNKQLEEKEAQIAQLEEELATSKKSIAELASNVEALSSSNQELTAQNMELGQIITDQTDQMNEGYFLAADKKKLESMGLMKGGFLKKSQFQAGNVNLSECVKVDIRKFNDVKLKSKKTPELLTQAPSGSYSFEKSGDKEYVLVIKDPQTFWSLSNVVVIKLNN